jgi:uncharacterized protein (TIGR02246 family)
LARNFDHGVAMTAPQIYAEIQSLVASLLEALRQQDAVACAALFTPDGLILSPYGPPVRGRDAIRATHQAWFEEGETNKRLTLLEARATAELGYCRLAYAGDYFQTDGSYSTHSGTSLNILLRQDDGNWRIHISCMNADD